MVAVQNCCMQFDSIVAFGYDVPQGDKNLLQTGMGELLLTLKNWISSLCIRQKKKDKQIQSET